MSVALSIVFTGLCALVTDGERAPADVLLVDARGVGRVNGVLLPDHAPTLVVSLNSLANAETSSPSRVVTGSFNGGSSTDQVGVWDLAGAEVRIRVQGGPSAGLELYRALEGTSSWPAPPRSVNDAASWRDLRFIADMRTLAGDGRIDSRLMNHDAVPAIPSAVAARIHLEGGRIEAGIPSHYAHRSEVFEFTGGNPTHVVRQALTDTVRWTLDSEASSVVIEIAPRAGGPIKRLVFVPNAAHSVFVSNLPAENVHPEAHHTLTSEEMAALHFGAYYELLRVKPSERPLPRLWVPPATRSATGLMGRPFCPPALFTRN